MNEKMETRWLQATEQPPNGLRWSTVNAFGGNQRNYKIIEIISERKACGVPFNADGIRSETWNDYECKIEVS